MRISLASALALVLAACSQDDAPSEAVAEQAEQIVAPAAATPFAEGPFAPRDECGELEGAAAFRTRLAEAVRLRDAAAVAALAAKDVMLDFGGGAGAAELKARLDDPERELWQALDQLLTLGCAANDEGGITLPWFWDQDIGDADPYAAMLVTGEDVMILNEPRGSADRLDLISWDLVEVVSYDPEAPFQEIKVPDGGTGFIATDKLRSVIDYRLLASSRNGKWSITTFIAGD